MLYLMRKQDESIIINNDIELKVIEIKGKSVKLGFQFPQGAFGRAEFHQAVEARQLSPHILPIVFVHLQELVAFLGPKLAL